MLAAHHKRADDRVPDQADRVVATEAVVMEAVAMVAADIEGPRTIASRLADRMIRYVDG